MTPETKAWIEGLKKMHQPKENSRIDSILDIPSFIGVEGDQMLMAIRIIEAQDKEIERLRSGFRSIIAKSHSWVIKEHGVYEAMKIHDGYRYIANKLLETK